MDEWYNDNFMEWFAFIGQITVCYLIHKFVIHYFFERKNRKVKKAVSITFGWIIGILIFAPSIKW